MKKIIFTFAFLVFIFYYSLLIAQPGWIVQTIGNLNENFLTLKFFTPNSGIVISGYAGNPSFLGRMFKTTNAGQNWNYTNFTSPDGWHDGYYFNDSNFALVGQRGTGPGIVAIYTNNIRSDCIISPLNGNITALTSTCWLDAKTGFIGGWDFQIYDNDRDHFGRVLKTTNHSVNWIDITPTSSSDVQAIKFFNFNTGYIIDGSSFKKTTNSGQNWTTISSILLSTEFNLITKDTFYVCGDNGNVRISSDSGHTWQLRPVGFNVTLRSIKFINSKHGWTCGDSGYIFRTTNAGVNWQKQNNSTNFALWQISIVDLNNLWIGGTKGIVLKTTTGGVTFIKKNTEEIIYNYKLFQNYPNPFNSVTNIKYELPKDVFVTIKIYDILGREIKTLVNEFQRTGEYIISFNGNNLASGVYFYRIKAGDFVQTKRMILLK